MRTEKRLWRRNAGNLLEQTVGGITTTFRYDDANQLLSRTSGNGFTVDCTYDAAGRLVREGERSFSYGWMDKVLSVSDGNGIRKYAYGLDGQLRSATDADGAVSEFLWDGLALIRRDGVDYLNELHPNGGSPILASDGRAFFNDILGTSQGTLNDRGYEASSLTAFGDGASDSIFFTGKPKVDDALGYAFLFRNYRSDHGKWLTADPMGYPDGWNNLAYCRNVPLLFIDSNGAAVSWAAVGVGAALGALGYGISCMVSGENFSMQECAAAASGGAVAGAIAGAITGDVSALAVIGIAAGASAVGKLTENSVNEALNSIADDIQFEVTNLDDGVIQAAVFGGLGSAASCIVGLRFESLMTPQSFDDFIAGITGFSIETSSVLWNMACDGFQALYEFAQQLSLDQEKKCQIDQYIQE